MKIHFVIKVWLTSALVGSALNSVLDLYFRKAPNIQQTLTGFFIMIGIQILGSMLVTTLILPLAFFAVYEIKKIQSSLKIKIVLSSIIAGIFALIMIAVSVKLIYQNMNLLGTRAGQFALYSYFLAAVLSTILFGNKYFNAQKLKDQPSPGSF